MADAEMVDILPSCPNACSTQISVNVDAGSHTALPDQNECTSITVETPYEGMEFLTHEDAYNHYKLYAQKCGFRIRKDSTNKSRKASGGIIGRTFVCNKAGRKNVSERESAKLIHRHPDTRVGCMAKLKIRLTTKDTWKVSKFVVEHQNHEFSSSYKVSNQYSREEKHPTYTFKSRVNSLIGGGIPPTAAQVPNDHFRITRKNNIDNDCLSIIRSFQDKRVTDPDFYFFMEVDHLGTLRSVFWAEGRSRSSYLNMGDVVFFDMVYKTDHLSLPFASFTGVNHHRESTLFGCALLADEEEDTFVWLFTEWLRYMHGIAPKAIITYQDAQIREAIKKVFPNTCHRFCPWHINKQIALQQVTLKTQYGDEFSTYFNRWYRASTISKCEKSWESLKKNFDIDENAESWLPKMYKLRAYWVDAYLKDSFWAGMTTNQRSESIKPFFDGYIDANTQLSDFVCQYDKAVMAHRASESQEDSMTLNTKPVMFFSHPLEVYAGKLYTRAILKIFQKEFTNGRSLFHEVVLKEGSKAIYLVGFFDEERDKWEEVTSYQLEELKITCTCAMFETDGIPCGHILHIMMHKQLTSIPDSYILHRWKINARHRNIGFANAMNLRKNGISTDQREIIRPWALRAKFNLALEMASSSPTLLSKLEKMLEDFIVEAEKTAKPKLFHIQDSQIGSQVDSSTPVVLGEGEDITDHEPDDSVKTKPHPKGVNMCESGLDVSQPKKEIKKRRCGNCHQLGHYKTSCCVNMCESGLVVSQPKKEIKKRRCGNCHQLGHYKTSCTILKK